MAQLASAVGGETVSKSDTVSYTGGRIAKYLYVGGTGDVTVLAQDATVVLFKAVPVGTTLNIRHTRVNSTGTSATLMTALF